jgi:CRISPR-associated protein Cas4
MIELIPISYLNDFVFCPYSIYLHQIFDDGEEETYSASPQQKGRSAHETIDNRIYKSEYLQAAYVLSDELGIYGKIDRYHISTKTLIERKRTVHKLYRGFYYQVWAQYYALVEMGYIVEKIIVDSLTDNKKINIKIPDNDNKSELIHHIDKIRLYNPLSDPIIVNPEKCSHCIYSSLCDKTINDHVYA